MKFIWLIFLPTPGNKTQPWYVLAIGLFIFVWIFAVVVWKIISASRQNTELHRLQANAIPICVWTFSEMEWIEYSKNFVNYKNPRGNAEIRFTEIEFCLTDANRAIRQILFAANFALTDCLITKKGIKARLRSYKQMRSSRMYKSNDIYFPIPHGKDADAAKIVDAWKKAIAEHSDMVAEVTPTDNLTGLFGETDF